MLPRSVPNPHQRVDSLDSVGSPIDVHDIYYETSGKRPKSIKQYILGEKIGQGSYGKVKEGIDSLTGRRVAIKIVKYAKIRKVKNGRDYVKREVQVMKRLGHAHDNIVQLIEVIHQKPASEPEDAELNVLKSDIYIVMEFIHGYTLQAILNSLAHEAISSGMSDTSGDGSVTSGTEVERGTSSPRRHSLQIERVFVDAVKRPENEEEVEEGGELSDEDDYVQDDVVVEYVDSDNEDPPQQSAEEAASTPTERKLLPLPLVKSLLHQLLDGLEYIHSKGVVHKDIKPENMMVTTQGELKIMDFGVAELLDTYDLSDAVHNLVGSPLFQPPEIALGEHDTPSGYSMDIWAAGITLYIMLVGKFPFTGNNMFAFLQEIGKGAYEIPDFVDEQAKSLIRGMMCVSVEQRFSLSQCLKHPFLTGSDSSSRIPLAAVRGLRLPELRNTSLLSSIQNAIEDALTVHVDLASGEITSSRSREPLISDDSPSKEEKDVAAEEEQKKICQCTVM